MLYVICESGEDKDVAVVGDVLRNITMGVE